MAAGVPARAKSRAAAGPVVSSRVRSERRHETRMRNGSRAVVSATAASAVVSQDGSTARRRAMTRLIVAASIGARTARASQAGRRALGWGTRLREELVTPRAAGARGRVVGGPGWVLAHEREREEARQGDGRGGLVRRHADRDLRLRDVQPQRP